MRIALIGHACGPNLGSEPGNTWNLAAHLAIDHDVWVLTHPQHRTAIDAYMASHANPRLRFVYVNVDPAHDTWDPACGEGGLRKHYLRWQAPAALMARQLCESEKIDVVHHFSLGTIKAPPHLQDIPAAVVWGPMGGGQVMPLAFRKYFAGHLPEELARIALAKMLPLLPRVRSMARRADVVLANNQETIDLLKKAGAAHAIYALETALPPAALETESQTQSQPVPPRHSEQRLIALWAGRIEPRKALPLALEAMAKTKQNVELLIAGDGPDRAACEALKDKLALGDRVTFLGRVPFDQMTARFRSADVFLFTSLRDSTGAVVLEAMAKSLPVLTLDHQGVRMMVPASAGIRVPVRSPEQAATDLAAAMDRLALDPALRSQLATGARSCAQENTWDRRAQQIAAYYAQAIARRAG